MPQVQDEHGKFLLRVGRIAIENYIKHNRKIAKPVNTPAELEIPSGIFLNLYKKVPIAESGELRGSAGYPFPQKTLIEGVIDAAVDASSHSKFSPLTMQEMPVIKIELHILSEPQLLIYKNDVDFFGKIKVGEHGFLLNKAGKTGIMLPSVLLKKKWSAREALDNLCVDYGLKAESWKDPSAKVWIFETQVFRDGN